MAVRTRCKGRCPGDGCRSWCRRREALRKGHPCSWPRTQPTRSRSRVSAPWGTVAPLRARARAIARAGRTGQVEQTVALGSVELQGSGTASRTSSDTPLMWPVSSRVYHSVLTPASTENSSRRRPATRRRLPPAGSPPFSEVSLARRFARKRRMSALGAGLGSFSKTDPHRHCLLDASV